MVLNARMLGAKEDWGRWLVVCVKTEPLEQRERDRKDCRKGVRSLDIGACGDAIVLAVVGEQSKKGCRRWSFINFDEMPKRHVVYLLLSGQGARTLSCANRQRPALNLLFDFSDKLVQEISSLPRRFEF